MKRLTYFLPVLVILISFAFCGPEKDSKFTSKVRGSATEKIYGKAWVCSYWDDEVEDMVLDGFMLNDKFYIVKQGIQMEVPDIICFNE